MEYQIYINQKKKISISLMQMKILIKKIKEQKYQEDKEELQLILRLILKVSNNHYRYPNFFNKIYKILEFLSQNIKSSLISNYSKSLKVIKRYFYI